MKKEVSRFLSRAKKAYDLKELERLGITPTLEQRDSILHFFALLFKWNPSAGLVSKKDEESLFLRHFCDSLQPLLLFGFKKNAAVLDIGAGGGFPSIPIQVFRPDLTFVLSESNRKKAMFLQEVIKELDLGNVSAASGRAEKMNTGASFDYVISRGLGTLQKFALIGKPYLKNDGRLYTFKGKNFDDELASITNNKDASGVRISEIAEYDLGNQIFGLKLVSLEHYTT